MVIRDDSDSFKNDEQVKAEPSFGLDHDQRHWSRSVMIASPYDRAAAVVIDYFILLMPFIYLALAPIQHRMKEAAITSDQLGMNLSILLAAMVTLTIIVAYQTFCHWLWGATAGKLLLGLRVSSIYGDHSLKLFQAFTRSVFWVLSWIFLAAPFFAVFSNVLRRPLHDRIADTMVYTKRIDRRVPVPTYQERALIRGVYWACAVFILSLVFTAVVSLRSTLELEAESTTLIENEELLCAEVEHALLDWPQEGDPDLQRLHVAMALFAAGPIDQKCLQYEVEYLLLKEKESPLIYLAKSFVYSDQPELSEMYLNKVCDLGENTHECRLSQIVVDVSNENWESVEKNFDHEIEKAPLYTVIWATRQFLENNNFRLAQKFAEKIPDLAVLSDFTVPSRAKILWGLDQKEAARGLELAAYSSLNDEAKLDVSSFICYEELWLSCSNANSHSCRNLEAMVQKVDDGISDVKVSLAHLRKFECEQSGKEQVDYADVLAMPQHPDVRLLVSALSEKRLEDISELLKDDTLNDEVANEVSRRMIARLRSVGALELIAKDWRLKRKSLNWLKTGETLFHKYFELKNYEASLLVLEELTKSQTQISKNVIENGIVAAVNAGRDVQAYDLLKKYSEVYPLPFLIERAERSPASRSEFVDSVLKLQRGVK